MHACMAWHTHHPWSSLLLLLQFSLSFQRERTLLWYKYSQVAIWRNIFLSKWSETLELWVTMAVPFSRPCYPRNPRNPRRGSTTARQQAQQPQEHPIARFLYGDGMMHLDRLNRLTRITFYALYEAWRLLQDLNPENRTLRRQRVDHQQQPDLLPERHNENERQNVANGVSASQSPMHEQQQQESAGSTRFQCTVDEQVDKVDREIFLPDLLQQTSRTKDQNLPDLINCNNKVLDSDKWEDQGYHSANSSLCSEDHIKDLDTSDLAGEYGDLGVKGEINPWAQSGLTLIQIASAFDMSYGQEFENDQQRHLHEAYQRLRRDILMSQARKFSSGHASIFEVGKAVLSQAILAGMWFMLKKIA